MNPKKKKEIGDLMKKKSLWGLWGCVLLILLVSSCFLTSGTWVIIYEVEDADIHPSQSFYKFTVDLTEEDIWKDHKDDIDDIADISFTFKLANTGPDTLTGSVYVSPDSTLGDTTAVKSSATIILDGISVAPGDTLQMTLAHYYDLLQHFDTLKDLVKSGKFTAYAIVPNAPEYGKFFDVIVVVTISAGI
jgi:hypothetical protein